MDFSLKQALGVVVVIAVAALVVIAAINITEGNNTSAKTAQNKMWDQATNLVPGS